MAKSLAVAYALWLTTGLLGGHQFYLGRIMHGMVYAQSAGLFGLGWLHDIVALSRYVREANQGTYIRTRSQRSGWIDLG